MPGLFIADLLARGLMDLPARNFAPLLVSEHSSTGNEPSERRNLPFQIACGAILNPSIMSPSFGYNPSFEQSSLHDEDSFGVGELLHPETAMFASVAGVFHTAERHVRRGKPEPVDEDHAGVEVALGQFHRAVHIF